MRAFWSNTAKNGSGKVMITITSAMEQQGLRRLEEIRRTINLDHE